MTNASIIQVVNLSHHYGGRTAVDGVSFSVSSGEIFGLLGPNGSGKTTVLQILSTMLPVSTRGMARVLDCDMAEAREAVRALIGVVFQSNSLDLELTVDENLRLQGALYGLHGQRLRMRMEDVLRVLDLLERRGDVAGKLSGGLRRRVEIAKALLHQPVLLLLDEPSTGLDPAARNELRRYLVGMRRRDGVTVLLATHLLEEAEQCDRLGIMDEGRMVVVDTPAALKSSMGGDIVTVRSGDPGELCARLQEKFGGHPKVVDGAVRIERESGHEFVPILVRSFPHLVESVSLGHPTLEDVFIAKTGHRLSAVD